MMSCGDAGHGMRWLTATGTGFILAAIILLFIAFLTGGVDIYVVLIIPVIRFTGWIGPLFFLSLFAGVLMIFISHIFTGVKKDDKKGSAVETRESWGGVVFIAPLPVVFGDGGLIGRSPTWWKLFLFGALMLGALYFAMILLAFFLV